MNPMSHRTPPHRRLLSTMIVLGLLGLLGAPAVHAQERESLESLRQTTLALIDALVKGGVLTRAQADALLKQAQEKAAAATAAAPAAAAGWGAPPAADATGNVVRVPYVPQVVRDQIRDEVKEEVVAQARTERWGVPNSVAEWTDRIRIEGDTRLRYQYDDYGNGNPSPEDFLIASLGGQTRAADFAAGTSTGVATGNTQDNRSRERVRARLAVTAKVNDWMSAGLRLTTGNGNDRVSTNQTLGQDFNKYTFFLDRAFIKVDPTEWLSISGGRIPNPWFSTEMQFSDSLNFEGVAATARWPTLGSPGFEPFLTAGYFPIREDAPPRADSRSLIGAQVGFQWDANPTTRVKLGLARYSYRDLQGKVDPDYDAVSGAGASYGQYEYGQGLRQRGNSLFLTNNPLQVAAGLTPNQALWGLSSEFTPLALTGAVELSNFSPVIVMLSGEVVKNTAYDQSEILSRTGFDVSDGKDTGYILRGVVGAQEIRNRGDWQFGLSYRYVGSDAVLDAFTDSDFGLGGTNLEGYTFSASYGLDRNASLGVRYLSAKTISSPTVQPAANDRFSVDIFQADFNVRF